MRAFLDANVLFPTVLREVLIGLAPLYQPLWSETVLDEWRHAVAARLGPDAAAVAGVEIGLLQSGHPAALVAERNDDPRQAVLDQFSLPDERDRHVIRAAISGRADLLITQNRRDFPPRVMSAIQITALSADEFVARLAAKDRAEVLATAQRVYDRARAAGATPAPRALFRRAQLPRLGRLIDAVGGGR